MSIRLDCQPLLFGEGLHDLFSSAQGYADHITRFNRALLSVDPAPGRSQVLVKTSTTLLGSLNIWDTIASALRVRYAPSAQSLPAILIPIAGQMRARSGRQKLTWAHGTGCVYLSELPDMLEILSEGTHYFTFGLDIAQLKRAAMAFFGPVHGQMELHLDDSRTLPYDLGGISANAFAKHVGSTISYFEDDVALMRRNGLDDFIYRQLIMLFRPDWRSLIENEPNPRNTSPSQRRAMDRICDTVLADLSRKISLTDMASIGHMSIRTMQYSFHRRFGVSAIVWLHEQRLNAARTRLLGRNVERISLLAQECGFNSASHFAMLYRRRFGESPIQTLRNS